MEFKSLDNKKLILNSNIDFSKLKIFVQKSISIKENSEMKVDSHFICRKNNKENNINLQNKKFKLFHDLVNYTIFEEKLENSKNSSIDSHTNSLKKMSEVFGVDSSLIISPRVKKTNKKFKFETNESNSIFLNKTLSLINSEDEINGIKKLSLKEKLKLKKSKMNLETPLTTYRSLGNNQSITYKTNRKFQKVPEDNKEYDIDINNMKNKKNSTLMIRNIPNKYTKELMLNLINKKFSNQYDFFYLPIDFQNKCNVGYAFINFKKSKYIKKFYLEFNNKKWDCSKKTCEVKYARIQGPEEYYKHFKGKTIIKHHDSRYKPLIQESWDNIYNLVDKQKKNSKQFIL